MAKLKIGDKSADVADGSNIESTAESLGIPISCGEGVCGSCICNVLEGESNLSDLNQKEKDYGLTDKKKRLACQVTINSGEAKLESGY